MFLDTNVLVYAFDDSEAEKRESAVGLLAARPERFVLSAQVLSEFYTSVTRKLTHPLSPDKAATVVAGFSALTMVSLDAELAREAISIHRKSQISYWDGLIVAAARAGGCDRLLTEDLNDSQVISGVRIENPFV